MAVHEGTIIGVDKKLGDAGRRDIWWRARGRVWSYWLFFRRGCRMCRFSDESGGQCNQRWRAKRLERLDKILRLASPYATASDSPVRPLLI